MSEFPKKNPDVSSYNPEWNFRAHQENGLVENPDENKTPESSSSIRDQLDDSEMPDAPWFNQDWNDSVHRGIEGIEHPDENKTPASVGDLLGMGYSQEQIDGWVAEGLNPLEEYKHATPVGNFDPEWNFRAHEENGLEEHPDGGVVHRADSGNDDKNTKPVGSELNPGEDKPEPAKSPEEAEKKIGLMSEETRKTYLALGIRDFLLQKGEDAMEAFEDGNSEANSLAGEFMHGKWVSGLQKKIDQYGLKSITEILHGQLPDLKGVDALSDKEIGDIAEKIKTAEDNRDSLMAAFDSDTALTRFMFAHVGEFAGVGNDMSKAKDIAKNFSFEKIENIMRAYNYAKDNGEIVAVQTDVSEDFNRVTEELSRQLYNNEIARRKNSLLFGGLRAFVYEKFHNEKSYLDISRLYIGSGGMNATGIISRHYLNKRGLSDGRLPSDYLRNEWSLPNPTTVFEKIGSGVEGVKMFNGESIDTNISVRYDEESKRWTAYDGNGDEVNGPEGARALELWSAMRTFAETDGGRAAENAFNEAVDSINSRVASGERMSANNYLEQARSLREMTDLGRSIESVNMTFITGRGGIRSSREGEGVSLERGRTLRNAIIEALANRREMSQSQIERAPRTRPGMMTAGELIMSLNDVMNTVRNSNDSEEMIYKEVHSNALPRIAEIEMYKRIAGSIIGSDEEMARMERSVDAVYGFFGEKADSARDTVNRILNDEAPEYKAKRYEIFDRMAERYTGGGNSLKIAVPDEQRREWLSGGNGSFIEKVINDWNGLPNGTRFGDLMGRDASSEGLLLRELGVLRGGLGGNESAPSRGTGEISADSVSTEILTNDDELRALMQAANSPYRLEDMRNAIAVWNTAPSHERRMVLMNGVDNDLNLSSQNLLSAARMLKGLYFERSSRARA